MAIAAILIEWAFRSSILIVSGAILLRALRVKDPSIRLAAWTAMLGGSLLIPAFGAALPTLPFDMNALARRAVPTGSIEAPTAAGRHTASPLPAVSSQKGAGVMERGFSAAEQAAANSSSFNWRWGRWMGVVAIVYPVIAGMLLLRLFLGLRISLRLLRESRVTGRTSEGIEIRESNRVHSPVTLGIARPAIVLPDDWRQWDVSKLDAVLAHERSHVWRRDPALQLVSLIHRAVLWHSPLSWFVHKRIVQAAEEVSDDAAVAATGNRIRYAEVLLDFMERSAWRGADGGSVAMARYGLPEGRIHRIVYGKTLSIGVTGWSLAAILILGSPLTWVVATAQARPEFEIADVHVSPLREDRRGILKMQEEAVVRGGRYEIRGATMVDLIRTAYSVEPGSMFGGPSWLVLDRFDVIAKAPEGRTTIASINLMLQSLLADRFKLVVRKDTKPLPAWALSKGTGNPKLKRADSSGDSACHNVDDNKRLSCRNLTMDAFVALLRAGHLTTRPVVNLTGIEDSWDFDLDYTIAGGMQGISENSPILDAVDKQLGLKLELQNIPQPVLVVESVNRNPTPNAADIQKRLPPEPVEFEVASIRPCQSVDIFGGRSSPSGQVTTGCLSLADHVVNAWNLCTQVQAAPNTVLSLCSSNAPGAPSWMNSKLFNIVAKAPIAIGDLDTDVNYRAMLRNLLVDRFKVVTHYEDQLVDVYTLVAARPKLKKADPSSRSGCKSNGLTVRVSTVVTCQNVTMTQFAEELERSMSIIPSGRRVVNASGIQGTWDLTLTYRVRPPDVADGVASDPTGGVSLFEALGQQLGLKLEKAKRRMPVFVLDHIEENPTEN